MSYLPDYRHEVDKLNEVDRAAVTGFRVAVEAMMNYVDSMLDEDRLTVEVEVITRVKAELEESMEFEEIELVCSLFDNADYLGEDVELTDARAAD